MKLTFKKAIYGAFLGLTAVGLSACSQAPATNEITQIIAFGDSMSDNGTAHEVSKAVLASDDNEGAFVKPGELYWENRYSNGNTAIEVASELAEKPLTNFATGGGTSGVGNYSDWMDNLGGTGVLGQIDKFQASLNGEHADQDALYFIFAGANDYCKFVDYALPGTVEEIADQVVNNLETAVRELNALGAQKFLVPSAVDVSIMPYEIAEGRREYAKTFVTRIDAQLPAMFESLEKELNISITPFNTAEVTAQIRENPADYNIVELETPAQPTWPEIKPVAENADDYLFFDEWHFSRVTHKILGEAFFETIKTIQ